MTAEGNAPETDSLAREIYDFLVENGFSMRSDKFNRSMTFSPRPPTWVSMYDKETYLELVVWPNQ